MGGAGNDTFIVDVSTDVITENANEGTDTVRSSVTWTLGTNLENLTLTGVSNINGTGNAADNVLTGNAGNNMLIGAAGADTLDGKAGNDTLNGGAGADTYWFGKGYGADLISDNDSTAGVKDVVRFDASIAQSDIRFTQSGNALVATIMSTSETLTIQDWYLGTQYRVEEFRFNDGSVLTSAQAQALVGAMASFSGSGSGMTSAATSDQSMSRNGLLSQLIKFNTFVSQLADKKSHCDSCIAHGSPTDRLKQFLSPDCVRGLRRAECCAHQTPTCTSFAEPARPGRCRHPLQIIEKTNNPSRCAPTPLPVP